VSSDGRCDPYWARIIYRAVAKPLEARNRQPLLLDEAIKTVLMLSEVMYADCIFSDLQNCRSVMYPYCKIADLQFCKQDMNTAYFQACKIADQ
jgi:hypothetical protein